MQSLVLSSLFAGPPYGIGVLTSALILATDVLVVALFASSLQFMMGVGGLASFGHAAYFGLGAYTYAVTAVNLGESTLAIVLSACKGVTDGLLRPESRTFALAYQLALTEFRPLLAQMLDAAAPEALPPSLSCGNLSWNWSRSGLTGGAAGVLSRSQCARSTPARWRGARRSRTRTRSPRGRAGPRPSRRR